MRSPVIVDIWHNILWSSYKGEVFSSLYELAQEDKKFDLRIIQKAETDSERAALSGIDHARHRYPYELLFRGLPAAVSPWRRIAKIVTRTLASQASLSILIEYEKPEFWLQYVILRLKRQKVAIFCDSTAFDRPSSALKNIVKKFLFRSVDAVLGYGQRTKEYVVSLGAKPEHVFVPCQAAALPYDYDPEIALQERLRLAPPSDAPRFLYVGRLAPEKNLDRLLEAFASIKMRMPQAVLIIVGSGNLKEPLAEKARNLGLAPDEIFVGSKTGADLFAEYAKATCLVLPSLSEPWGLVVNEALAYGCPVVVSERCGCVPELVREGATGYRHNPLNADDVAAKLLLAAQSFANAEESAKACIDLMRNYTPRNAASVMKDGLEKLL
ncbi:MAG: glycosyltransferase [Bdellovibrionales bacterium]